MLDNMLSRKRARKALKDREARAQSYLEMGQIDALRNTERIGEANRAAAQQSTLSRGLYNTTALDQATGAADAEMAQAQGNIRRDFAARKADLTTQFAETAGDSGGYQALGSAMGLLLAQGEGANKSGVQGAASTPAAVDTPLRNEMIDSSSFTSPADRMKRGGGEDTLRTATMTQAPAQVALQANRMAASRRRAKAGGYSGMMI